jgi:cellulose synthase (UDP-forming)
VWPDEQRFFFDTVMASKDAWGAAFCCGTSSLIRFGALESIGGGFPTDSVTEDYLLTLRLREKGFRTVYLNEVLSLGLAPEGLKEYYGQRSRWCLGAIQICRGPSGPLRLRNRLPIFDRIGLIDAFLFWSASHLMRLVAFVIPALYLLFGVQAVHANVTDAIAYAFPYFMSQFVVLMWLTESRIMPIMSEIYQTLCATEVLKAVVSGFAWPNRQKFKVTAKGSNRGSLLIQWPMLRIFLVLLAMNALGIANTFLFNKTVGVVDASKIALFWSWYNILVLVLVCYVCIEHPQRRGRHRFLTNELVKLEFGVSNETFAAYDISVSGIGLKGSAPIPIGSDVILSVGSFKLRARIVRLTEKGFALEFGPTLNNRAKIIRHIFAKRYLWAGRTIEPVKVALAIATKLVR